MIFLAEYLVVNMIYHFYLYTDHIPLPEIGSFAYLNLIQHTFFFKKKKKISRTYRIPDLRSDPKLYQTHTTCIPMWLCIFFFSFLVTFLQYAWLPVSIPLSPGISPVPNPHGNVNSIAMIFSFLKPWSNHASSTPVITEPT